LSRAEPPTPQRRLKEALRAAHLDAGLTQVELAKKLGKQQGYISKIELGERYLGLMDFIECARLAALRPPNLSRKFEPIANGVMF
jgi:transcriptional regulator with XRE-family HTH domain